MVVEWQEWKIKRENAMKEIPVLYERKEDCCGCTACYAICPKSAISMQTDEEGFLYPVIDEELCVMWKLFEVKSHISPTNLRHVSSTSLAAVTPLLT